MMRTIVDLLIVQSAAGGLLIIFMLLVRKICAEKITSGLMYVLWLFVALRMLIPLELPGCIKSVTTDALEQQTSYMSKVFLWEQNEAIPAELIQYADAENSGVLTSDQAEEADSSSETERPKGRTAAKGQHAPKFSMYNIVFWSWLTGACLTGAYLTVTNCLYMRKVKRLAVRRPINCELPVYCAEVESPFLSGIFRQAIYINPKAEQDSHLRYVLAHELEHARHHDNLWLLMRNIVCVLYWFHPMVWIAASLSTRDCEKACDERVAAGLTKAEKVDYAGILLEMSVMGRTLLPMINAVVSGKRTMAVRIARILQGKPVKRWVSVLTTVIMLTVSVFSCATGEASEKDRSTEEAAQSIPVVSAGPKNLAMLFETEVFVSIDNDWTSLGKFPDGKLIAAGEENLFIYTEGKEENRLIALGFDGGERASYLLPEALCVQHMVCAGNTVYLTAKTDAYSDIFLYMPRGGSLYVMDVQSGSVAPSEHGTVFDLCADEQGRIYIIRESDAAHEWEILRISPWNGSSEKVYSMPPMETSQIAADSEGIYLYREGRIEFLDFATGETERMIHDVGELRNLVYGIDGLYACDSDGKIQKFDENGKDEEAGKVLTIANFLSSESPRAIYMQKWFEQEYPDAKLSYVTVSRDKLATRLMSGDSEIDMVWGESSSMMPMVPSGAYMPLDDMETLKRSMEEAGFVDYRAALSHGGKLYGVPDMISFFSLRLNEPLLESLNLKWPEAPYSYEELSDWAIDALEGTPYFLISDNYSLNPAYVYLDVYLQEKGEVLLDTREFRESMEAYKRLWQMGLIGSGEDGEEALATGERLSHTAHTPMPTLQGRTVSHAQIHGFFVTTNTRNKDMAEAYLAEWVGTDCQYQATYGIPAYMLIKDSSGYLKSASYESEYPAAAERMRLESYETIVLYRRNPDMAVMLVQDTEGDMNAYLNGRIDIEEFMGRAQLKLDMIQFE